MATAAAEPDFGSEVALLPIAAALWGASCIQTFLYYVHHSHRNMTLLTFLVAWLWIMDTAHIFVAFHGVYALTVTHWGDIVFTQKLNQEYVWSIFLVGMVSCPVQLFFTYRLWIMSRKNWGFVAFFAPLAIAQPAVFTGFAILCYKAVAGETGKNIVHGSQNLLIAGWSMSAGCDVLLSASLLYYIRQYRKSSIVGFESSSKIFDRMAVLTINTGVWTAAVSVITIIALVTDKTAPLFTATSFLLSPLYCNTFLANLNSRGYIQGQDFSTPVVQHSNTVHSDLEAKAEYLVHSKDQEVILKGR